MFKTFLPVFLLWLAACGRTPESKSNLMPTEVGNGGYGIYLNGKLYLYDLAENLDERGVERLDKNEDFEAYPSEVVLRKFYMRNLSDILPDDAHRLLSAEERGLFLNYLAGKLAVTHTIDPILASALKETLMSYRWVFTDGPFHQNTIEPLSPVKSFGNAKIVLLAHRMGRNIYIDKALFKQLSVANKVGLIFHEVIYSLLKTQKQLRVRQITTLFFESLRMMNLTRYGSSLIGADELPQGALTNRETVTYNLQRRDFGLFGQNQESADNVVGEAQLSLSISRSAQRISVLDSQTAVNAICAIPPQENQTIRFYLTFQPQKSFRLTFVNRTAPTGSTIHLNFEKLQAPIDILFYSVGSNEQWSTSNPILGKLVLYVRELFHFLNPKKPKCDESWPLFLDGLIQYSFPQTKK